MVNAYFILVREGRRAYSSIPENTAKQKEIKAGVRQMLIDKGYGYLIDDGSYEPEVDTNTVQDETPTVQIFDSNGNLVQ